ncbi:MAG TPA: hypothetical protein VF131_09405 [Blastocatellia bacterium]|nr:hypothetical protein [Blastocatellia bacterium]
MRSKLIASVIVFVLLSFIQVEAQDCGQLAAISSFTNGKREAMGHQPSYGRAIDFILANMTEQVRKEFEKAWDTSGAGTSAVEGLVLLYRLPDGSLLAKVQDTTNESRKVSFKWTPSIIAVVHTHSNMGEARPLGDDLVVSNRFQIPVFTITNRGMFVYDPATKKISRVMKNLTWLSPTRPADSQLSAKANGREL